MYTHIHTLTHTHTNTHSLTHTHSRTHTHSHAPTQRGTQESVLLSMQEVHGRLLDIVALLLSKGVEPAVPDRQGHTPADKASSITSREECFLDGAILLGVSPRQLVVGSLCVVRYVYEGNCFAGVYTCTSINMCMYISVLPRIF